MNAQRLDRTYALLQQAELQALALVPGPTLYYLSGLSFHLMERPIVCLLLSDRPPCMVVPELERAKVEGAGFEGEIFAYGEQAGASAGAAQSAARYAGLVRQRAGVEATHMRYLELSLLQAAAPQVSWVAADGALASLRAVKEPAEIECMQRAAVIAEQALEATLPLVQSGMTERELAAELTLQLLRAGDLLILDWGARVQGYISDLTRTFAVGEVEAELSEIHAVVQRANQAGVQAVRPGLPCSQVDRAARQVIEAAGYGEYFIHRTGHGLGLEGHEPPYIRQDEDSLLQPGMTFTVEPGIYLSGRGGVRVEDDVVVTDRAGRSLSNAPKEMRRVG
jgi:Xaa-Pro dipeptidase